MDVTYDKYFFIFYKDFFKVGSKSPTFYVGNNYYDIILLEFFW